MHIGLYNHWYTRSNRFSCTRIHVYHNMRNVWSGSGSGQPLGGCRGRLHDIRQRSTACQLSAEHPTAPARPQRPERSAGGHAQPATLDRIQPRAGCSLDRNERSDRPQPHSNNLGHQRSERATVSAAHDTRHVTRPAPLSTGVGSKPPPPGAPCARRRWHTPANLPPTLPKINNPLYTNR